MPRNIASDLRALEQGIRNAQRELKRSDISPEARAGWQDQLTKWQREAATLRRQR